MGKPVKDIVNFKTAGNQNPSEITFQVKTIIQNATIDWTERNFEELTLEIWTGPGSTGTQLILDTDYSLSLRNDFVSTKSGLEIYSGVNIINVTYLDVDLYVPINTLNMFGDFIDKSDLNRIVPSYDTYNITTGAGAVHALPDALTDVGEQTIKRRGAGAGIVTFTTVSGQTINGLSAASWNLEGEGTIVVYPSGGNWEVKAYNDYGIVSDSGADTNRKWWKYADRTMKQIGLNPITLVASSSFIEVVTFGKAFAVAPKVSPDALTTYGINHFLAVGVRVVPSTTTVTIGGKDTDATVRSGTWDMTYTAIGEW